jgi:multidrug efflux pump subunit AcrA (membrane-fusion protein)
MAEVKKEGKMTVFRSDRHEDMAAIFLVSSVVVIVLCYMAFVVPNVTVKAPSDGKVTAVATQEGSMVRKGDLLCQLEVVEKKYAQGVLQEKSVQKDIKAKTNGKIISVAVKAGDAVKKDKSAIVVLDHEKGTLP